MEKLNSSLVGKRVQLMKNKKIIKQSKISWAIAQFLIIVILQNVSQLVFLGIYHVWNPNRPIMDVQSQTFLFFELLSTGLSAILVVSYAWYFSKLKTACYKFSYQKLSSGYRGIMESSVAIGCITIISCCSGVGILTINPLANPLKIVCFGLAFLIQGISEELIFRWYLLSQLTSKFSITISIVIDSLLFSFVHIAGDGASPLNLLNLFLFSIWCCLNYYYRQNIWITGVMHGFWNFDLAILLGSSISGVHITGMLATLDNTSTEIAKMLVGGDQGLESGGIVTLVILVVCLLYGLIIRKMLVNKDRRFKFD